MSRFAHALFAGAAAASLLMAAAPVSHHQSSKTKPAPAHAHPVHMTTHAVPHVTTRSTTTVRGYEKAHTRSSARYIPSRPATQHGVARETVTRLENESTTRIHEIGHTTTPLGHVALQRTAIRTLVQRRPPISNARFVTGTVVSRQTNTIVLRTQSGSIVTVAAQAVPVPALPSGATVVLPVQYVNSQLVLVPAFTAAQQAITTEPMLAPCAINDYDADDAGVSGYYAPASACLNNDGDADDGYNFSFSPLPSSFGSIPHVFTSSYAPVVASGFVVSQIGSNVLLMTPDFKPLVVNASAALSSGATNGSLTPGRYVVAYGFDVNNTLVATTFM